MLSLYWKCWVNTKETLIPPWLDGGVTTSKYCAHDHITSSLILMWMEAPLSHVDTEHSAVFDVAFLYYHDLYPALGPVLQDYITSADSKSPSKSQHNTREETKRKWTGPLQHVLMKLFTQLPLHRPVSTVYTSRRKHICLQASDMFTAAPSPPQWPQKRGHSPAEGCTVSLLMLSSVHHFSCGVSVWWHHCRLWSWV